LKDGMIVYFIPHEHELLPVQETGGRYKINCHGRRAVL
jgi:hypothetical protein